MNNYAQELLEARLTEATKHFMTKREREVRHDLCKLLIKNNHRQYARRFWELDLNLVDSSKEPNFIAAISFDEATVFISDAFLNGGPSIFNQLDTVLRHELAHNLMMHQIRMMHTFKQKFASENPDEAYEQIKYSVSLHELINWIEDFEISNTRYSNADKQLARALKLNGREIHGLVTEDHRDAWKDMSLESMYYALSAELAAINTSLRNDPNWRPIKAGSTTGEIDGLALKGASLIYGYMDTNAYSELDSYGITLDDIEADTGDFSKYPAPAKKIIKLVYDTFKSYKADNRQADVKKVLDDIAASGPEESVTIKHPDTGAKIVTLYSADFKIVISNLLKKIIEEPIKLPQSFVDAWTKVMQIVPPENLSDEALDDLISRLQR
jgi:hypothetical protein